MYVWKKRMVIWGWNYEYGASSRQRVSRSTAEMKVLFSTSLAIFYCIRSWPLDWNFCKQSSWCKIFLLSTDLYLNHALYNTAKLSDCHFVTILSLTNNWIVCKSQRDPTRKILRHPVLSCWKSFLVFFVTLNLNNFMSYMYSWSLYSKWELFSRELGATNIQTKSKNVYIRLKTNVP